MVYQRAGEPNIDSPVCCRPSLSVWEAHQRKGKHSCTDVAAASSHPIPAEAALAPAGAPRAASGAGTGGSSRTGAGTGMGSGGPIPALPVRSPVTAQVSPAATQPSQERQGWGEEGRLGSPIKFYTSLHCFSGCFQKQKIQEIYSQMFPCLFVDSV